MLKTLFAGILAMLLSAPVAWAAGSVPWLPNILSDHMVLQRGRPIPLWGRDLPGTAIRATLNGTSASTMAAADGRWSLKLPAQEAGGPYELVVAGSVTRTVADVLLGEVWLGSGQSNMELALRATKDRDAELTAASDSQIRFFSADHRAAFQPQDDLVGSWVVCRPETAASFSGVAYHFGKALRRELGAPVGMIVSCWGGTPGEAWVPREGLDQEASLAPLLQAWDADRDRHELWDQGEGFDLTISDLRFSPVQKSAAPLTVSLAGLPGQGLGGSWSHVEKADSSGAYESGTEDGVAVGRYHGKIHGGAWASAVGRLKANGSADLGGAESVDLRVKGRGRILLSLGQPSIKDYDNYASGAITLSPDWQDWHVPLDSLKQGGWGEPQAFSPKEISSINFSVQVPYWPDLAAVAYNGMVAPLTRTPVQGVLWYQGESNTDRAQQYQAVLGRLMQSWRKAWGQKTLPFLVVQLPNFADAAGWGALRDAQRRACQGDPYCSLTSTLDVGESHNLHPKDKRTVGERLAAAALAMVYDRKGGALTPALRSAQVKAGKVVLRFDPSGGGLRIQGQNLSGGLELAGADGIFKPAQVELHGDQVVAWSPEVPDPRRVRHAWAQDPSAYLEAGQGPPVPCFEQDLP